MAPIFFAMLIIMFCFGASVAPPTGNKRPRVEMCLVQMEAFKGAVTPCDGGDLQKLSDLATVAAPWGKSFGAGNLVELLLARGGIFDDQVNLESLHICLKHREALGADWTNSNNNIPKFRKGSQQITRCNVPSLEGYPHVEHVNYVAGPKSVYLAQSKAVWRQLLTFVPPGTGNYRLRITRALF
jgi:hypothetical protein